jgi:spore photoproduct lyase
MIDTLYAERAVLDHPRARRILERFPGAVVVPVDRYGEVFNRNQQSFRLQKRKPSLILAEKQGQRLAKAPYGIGGNRNFYFSHVLNCLYDCRYCFLQGMYRSAHYVLFVNYEDFQEDIETAARESSGDDTYFFSGYDGDSLALEPLTGFLEAFLPFFAARPRMVVELRTKSVAIRPLVEREPFPNCVAAFSFTPSPIWNALERGVPPVELRIEKAAELARRGWRVGLRFDPLVYVPDFAERYGELFRDVFAAIPREAIHSVGMGAFRLPHGYFHRLRRLYPEEKLFAAPFEDREGMTSYPGALEDELRSTCRGFLLEYVPESILFSY